MKKIGIVGGIAWLSTVEYYRTICRLSQASQENAALEGPPSYPEMVIESLDISKSFGLRGRPGDEASWGRFDAYFHAALERLEASGADFALIASNTPHNRYAAITQGIGIPVLSIFEVVAKACAGHGVRDALILGTAPTMSLPVFPAVLRKHGVAGVAPHSAADRAKVVELIDELHAGRGEGGAELIRGLAEQAFPKRSGARPAVCLSCTELPLAFPEFVDEPTFELDGVLFVNTTILHATAAFDFARAGQLSQGERIGR